VADRAFLGLLPAVPTSIGWWVQVGIQSAPNQPRTEAMPPRCGGGAEQIRQLASSSRPYRQIGGRTQPPPWRMVRP
jgi:hypothetical protein